MKAYLGRGEAAVPSDVGEALAGDETRVNFFMKPVGSKLEAVNMGQRLRARFFSETFYRAPRTQKRAKPSNALEASAVDGRDTSCKLTLELP